MKKLLLMLVLPLSALLIPLAHAQVTITPAWIGATFTGFDPYYCPTFGSCTTPIHAYKTGTTASLVVSLVNTTPPYYENVTSVTFAPDWGINASNTTPLRINAGQVKTVTITFQVPDTATATNTVRHAYTIFVRFTTNNPGLPGVQNTNSGEFTDLAVYSADQATAISLMQQFGLPSTSLATTVSPCGFGSFKTSEALSLCLQSQQQVNLGLALYSAGNFTGSKTVLQNAVGLWNQAISTESSKGATIQQGAILGSYGSLLLGIGGIIGAIALVIYASMRRGSRSPSATTTH
jgi:hypothetical protein